MKYPEETITQLMQERNISRKSAVQYLRRSTKTTLQAIEQMKEPTIHGTTSCADAAFIQRPAPVDQSETILSDVPATATALAVAVAGAAARHPDWVKDMVVALHNDNPTPTPVVCDNLSHPSAAHKKDEACYKPEPAPAPTKATPGYFQRETRIWNPARAVDLYKAGMRIIDIAVEMGYPRGSGNNRTKTALVKAGVITK